MIHKGRLKFLFQTASFYFPNLKRNNAVGVGRILESDACSQNKGFKNAENVGHKYPAGNVLGRLKAVQTASDCGGDAYSQSNRRLACRL